MYSAVLYKIGEETRDFIVSVVARAVKPSAYHVSSAQRLSA